MLRGPTGLLTPAGGHSGNRPWTNNSQATGKVSGSTGDHSHLEDKYGGDREVIEVVPGPKCTGLLLSAFLSLSLSCVCVCVSAKTGYKSKFYEG